MENRVISLTVKCLLVLLAVAGILWVLGVGSATTLLPYGLGFCAVVVVAALVYANIQARQTEDR